MRLSLMTCCALAVCALGPVGQAAAQTTGSAPLPIPKDPNNANAPVFTGGNATANPFRTGSPAQNPFMAPNGRSNIHNDAYMTDTYRLPGPLGDGAETSALFSRECASVTFDTQGRIVTICVGLDRPVLALLDPVTLTPLATMPLPVRNAQGANANVTSDFSGGGYFYLDHRDRAVLPTNERHILEVAIVPTAGDPVFNTTRDYDVSGAVGASDGIISVLPDWKGRLWFITRQGTVGTVERDSGAVRILRLGEGISNSFAVDETGGVFVVSDKALYRFSANGGGAPRIDWRVAYPNSGVHKPGQSDAGSGTTPTLMGRGKKGWVAITDNADPMNVQVYRRAAKLGRNKSGKKRKRAVCHTAVFKKGAGSTDQSLIGTSRSLVVENNYGYAGVTSTTTGNTTQPGLSRIDVVTKRVKKGKGKGKKRKRGRKRLRCKTKWTSQEISPSAVPKLSLTNGLVYTYTKPDLPGTLDGWYLTAIDFRSGRTIYSRLAGTGFGHNNNFSPITLSRDGTAYVGVLGGIVRFAP